MIHIPVSLLTLSTQIRREFSARKSLGEVGATRNKALMTLRTSLCQVDLRSEDAKTADALDNILAQI
jgi:hypothetical protein